MEPMEPRSHSRRILLAVTGLTPQIVTETLYALAVVQQPVWVPTEIRLITTREGAERARLALLHDESGWFHRLRADYRLPEITFDANGIHVLEDAAGQPLADIRTPGDNTRTADAIIEQVRALTENPDSALHVSIAGGRKTMGFYLGYALSLYGRPQDRMSHVLVSPPFESHPEFYYPSPRSELIHTPPPNGRPYDKRDAVVTLAEIPFVRMRDGLSEELLAGRASFSDAVAEAQRALPPVSLELDPSSCTVTAGGESFELSRSKFAFYWMMAARAQAGKPGLHWSEEETRGEFLSLYGKLTNPMSGHYEAAEDSFRHGLTASNFDPQKSHVNRRLDTQLSQRHAAPYRIVSLERIPGTRYSRFGLKLPPEAIRIAASSEETRA